MFKMILFFMLLNSFIMYFINNPLSMGLFILMQTLLACLITGMMINTYWFSYILFLTFLGGLMVLFIYVCSIASNELMKFSYNLMFFIMICMIIFIFFNYFYSKILFNFNSDMMKIDSGLIFNSSKNKINLNKLYNTHTYLLMMMLIIYLFITLIAVVMINNINLGPLRSNFF